jgi:outer membrane protein assembly factor BamE
MHNLIFCLVLTLTILPCTGCVLSPYYREFNQGNINIEKTQDKLTLGMTKEAVLDLMGDPLLKDPFHPDRWDYVYYQRSKQITTAPTGFTLWFKNDRLAKIEPRN